LGVAVGAVGGALATVGAKLSEMHWWQLPLIVIGVMLAISLPAVIIAFLKLRQRTLGPILDANGWAVNGRVKINIPFGTALTDVAKLPSGSISSLEDPYEDKEAAKQKRRATALLVLLLLAAATAWILWNHRQTGRYFWQPAPAAAVAPAAATPAPAAPAAVTPPDAKK
jgi:ABC-type uncharacterized transport system permease subunit